MALYLEVRVVDEFDQGFDEEMLDIGLLINFGELIPQEADELCLDIFAV